VVLEKKGRQNEKLSNVGSVCTLRAIKGGSWAGTGSKRNQEGGKGRKPLSTGRWDELRRNVHVLTIQKTDRCP